jgi:outer membrane protein assembly factor BamB
LKPTPFKLIFGHTTLCLSAALLTPVGAAPTPSEPVHCLTFHYDNARLGWNPRETALSPASVGGGKLGRAWDNPLDGFVNGSPLVVGNLRRGKSVSKQVVFAATDHNSIFALDGATGRILWSRKNLAPPITELEFNGGWSDASHGVLSTMVIELATGKQKGVVEGGTLYACGIRRVGLQQQFVVWALDIASGKSRAGWPVAVRASYKGRPFVAGQVMQRGALSLVNGQLIVPFGGRGDTPPWRGWAVAIDTRNPKKTQRAFSTSPFSDGAGLWSAGGLSADEAGDLFAVTGNGDFDLFKGGDNLGQTVLRLKNSGRDRLAFSRSPRDYYTPPNYKHLDDQDEDMGGASALVLPPLPKSRTPRLLFTGGKDGLVYLLNRDRLGGIGGQIQKERLFGDPKAIYHEGIRATPAYFDGGARGRFLFVAGDQTGPQGQNGVAALRLSTSGTNGAARVQQVWALKTFLERPSSPTVSSRGTRDAVLWVTETRDVPGPLLRAYDAMTGRELYNSDSGPARDKLIGARRFIAPTVASGHVFVGARGVFCYAVTNTVRQSLVPPKPKVLTAAAPTPAPTPTPTPTGEPPAYVEGTVVSLRGNILVVRPTLRPKPTRVAFDNRTEILSYKRGDKTDLRPGMRVGINGGWSEKEGLSLSSVEYSRVPISYLQEKSEGLTIQKEQGWFYGRGTLKSVIPFTFADDAGKEQTLDASKLRRVWRAEKGDRNTLLIGTRLDVVGTVAPDGVVSAKTIYPARTTSATGTMFARILSSKTARGVRTLQIRPRFTSDVLSVVLAPRARLMKQQAIAVESIKVGQALTFWGEQRLRPWDRKKSTDLKALALLLGPNRYPVSTEPYAPRYHSGILQSLNPPRLKIKTGSIKVLPTAQMPIARLNTIGVADLRRGADAMLVLKRRNDGSFEASTVIIDAPPWVGYGG